MYEDLDRWIRGGTAEQKRGHSQSFQSRREDKVPEKPQEADSAKKEEKEIFGVKIGFSSGGRSVDEETVIGFDAGANQAKQEKIKRAGNAGQQQVPPLRQETPEPVRGGDVTIRQYIDEKTAEKGGKILTTAGNGRQMEVTVPPNWKDGMKLRLRACGKPGKNGGEPGDTYLELLILKPKKKKDRATKANTEKKGPPGSRGTLWILIGIIVVQNLLICALTPLFIVLPVGDIVMARALDLWVNKQDKSGKFMYLACFFFYGALISIATSFIVGFIHIGLMFLLAKLMNRGRKS